MVKRAILRDKNNMGNPWWWQLEQQSAKGGGKGQKSRIKKTHTQMVRFKTKYLEP